MPLLLKTPANSDENLSNWSSRIKSKKPKKKEEESRVCEQCQKKKQHNGYNHKKVLSTQGEVKLNRVYWEWIPCQRPEYPVDTMLGLEAGDSIGARRLAVFAGTNWSFKKAEKSLKEFCGLAISENTIRKLCLEESQTMEVWQNNDAASHKPFREAEGETEFTTDGTCVNTTEGWKEMRIGIFSKREPGKSATPQEWASRHLPRPHVAIAFAAVRILNYELRIMNFVRLSFVIQNSEFVIRVRWYDTMRSDLLEGGAKPLLDRVRAMAEREQLDRNKEALRLLENDLVFHSGQMNDRERLEAVRSKGPAKT